MKNALPVRITTGLLMIILIVLILLLIKDESLSKKEISGNQIRTEFSSSNKIMVGANLKSVNYFSNIVFNDLMLQSKPWVGNYTSEDFDENGWPIIDIPQKNGTLQTAVLVGQYSLAPNIPYPPQTTMNASRFPLQNYTLMFDGEGTIRLKGFGINQRFNKPGKYNIDLQKKDNGALQIIIESSNSSDHVRNIKFLLPGYSENPEENKYGVFYNPLIEKAKNFAEIRFMDWGMANDYPCSNNYTSRDGQCEAWWSDRPLPGQRQTTGGTGDKGVAIEYMVDFANYANADAWFNVPTPATDEYVKGMATIIKQRLNPNLKAYVEYGNEVWNYAGAFAGTRYVEAKSRAMGFKQYNYYPFYAKRSGEIFCMFKEAGFSDEQLITVIGGHAGAVTSGPQIMMNLFGNYTPPCEVKIDAYATASYFRPALPVYDNDTIEQLANKMNHTIWNVLKKWHQTDKNLSDLYGLDFITYEVGSEYSALQSGARSDALVNNLVILGRSPIIKQVYFEESKMLREVGAKLFNAYTLVGSPSKYGSYNHLEYSDQEPYITDEDGLRPYKYEALLEIMQEKDKSSETPTPKEENKEKETFQKILKNFDGKTTNIEKINDLKNINDFTIENTNYGLIKFLQRINLLGNKTQTQVNLTEISTNIDKYVRINKSTVTIESQNLPELNSPATITMYNLTFDKPIIIYDGEKCPEEICQIISYDKNSGELTFIVNKFSTYNIIEGKTIQEIPRNNKQRIIIYSIITIVAIIISIILKKRRKNTKNKK